MKVEIKKIHLMSLLFSVFPLAVFVVMLCVGAVVEMFDPEVTSAFTLGYAARCVMNAVGDTVLFLVSAVFFVAAYNFLNRLGIRGVQIDLEDK